MTINNQDNIINEIKSEPRLLKLIIDHNLSDTFIKNNLMKFYDVLLSLRKCRDCQGLFMCSQKNIGELDTLEYDEILIRVVEECEFNKEKTDRESFIKRFLYSDIPDKLYDLRFKDIELDEKDSQGLYIELNNILDGIRDKGLYIYGDLGVGKTFMSIALANELVAKDKSVAFVKVNNYISEIRRAVVNDSVLYDEMIENLKKPEYLFLDDIGSESVSTFSRDDVLFTILDYRLENKLMTIFTSNLSKEELEKHFVYDKSDRSSLMNAKRLIERIDILSDDYVLTGKNKRR